MESATNEPAAMEPATEDPKPSMPEPEAEASHAADAGATVNKDSDRLPREDYEVMFEVIQTLSIAKDEDGHEVSRDFARIPSKKSYPEYYDVIKEAMAISTIKAKITKKQYTSYTQFIRDLALITHNAMYFNRPSALVYKYALAFRELVKIEAQKLVEKKIITPEQAEIPDFGELPPVEPSPSPGPEEEEEEDEDDEDEDEEEDDGTDDDSPKKRGRKRGRRSFAKREKADEGAIDPDSQKKRGRPPKVLTPMEARINNLLKSLRKEKNTDGRLKITPFEKLPDKAMNPEYFQEVANPIAMDLIKKKAKRKYYHSVDQVQQDLERMFSNAMSYNMEDSEVHKAAKDLLDQSRITAEKEKNKPDSAFVDEDGRLPLPEILHNGKIWKIGDWVHIENINDPVKPIVAQIYRTWQDSEGQKWVNACWYYRPEQTVHHFEKHFFENEVVKTGRYCDHKVEEIKERCFVMFCTRFFKGRPRGFPADADVYVCEARYNEEKFEMNKIKTWTSCIPDEVRDKDYEMDLFDTPRPAKKVPSPIKHLLQEDATEDGPLPKPTWSAHNCPPIVGAVHRRPSKNQSPPPEPTPSPQPPPPVEPVRRPGTSDRPRYEKYDSQGDVNMNRAPSNPAPSPMANSNAAQASYGQQFAPSRPSISPAPALHHQNSYGSHGSVSHSTNSQTPMYQTQTNYGQYGPSSTPAVQHTNPIASYDQYRSSTPSRPSTQTSNSHSSHGNAYNPPRAGEVWTLQDAQNAAIPADVRSQFQTDDNGKVLFFNQPPLVTTSTLEQGLPLGHSLRYLADKARAKATEDKKRKAETDDLENLASQKLKHVKKGHGGQAFNNMVAGEKEKHVTKQAAEWLLKWTSEHGKGTDLLYQQMYGDEGSQMRKIRDEQIATGRAKAIEDTKEIEDYFKARAESKKVPLTGFKF
ncbi:chromatin structure-remodeling complex protein RSC2 [Phlyctema vagabunda]|uniref:Chromatin structure-remodeling complex protein RSC2 n=1 Tax=Phlyctema vagabunda TaxID=108571 RepID=A0ABR4PSB3_9HELO